MNGATVVVETLRRAGVTTVFSLSGNQIMPIYDACIDGGLRIVHVRHEAAAVYMADGWAQVTGELGVALVTAAPGFANAISALYTARMAESPVLFLSGDAPASGDGTGPFQELDQVAISRTVVKHAARPRSIEALGSDLATAIRIARSGRPGPSHVALPFDVLNAEGGTCASAEEMTRVHQPPETTDVERIVHRLSTAERPLIVTGPALSDSRAGADLDMLRQATGAPVVPIESPRGLRDPALGAFPDVLREADLLVSIGKVLDFAVGFARPPALQADVIAIDAEPAALEQAERLCGERLAMRACADADLMVRALAKTANGASDTDWTQRVASAIAHRAEDSDAGDKIHPREVGEAVQTALDAASDPILICDGGEFGQWAQACCSTKTRLINGLSGAIGGGLCYAIAAKIARPDATVIAMMGDGTAGFHFAEFETAAREKANIIAIVGNDARWNAEHQIQLRDYGPNRTIGCELLPTARYDQAAVAFGCHGARLSTASDLDDAVGTALTSGKPACLDIDIASLAAPKYSAFE